MVCLFPLSPFFFHSHTCPFSFLFFKITSLFACRHHFMKQKYNEMMFLMHNASVVLFYLFDFTACCLCPRRVSRLSPLPLLHQSIFMFPLSFSSSSSLSSLPPSLDTISELDHGLSDISEDDNLIDATATASHALWALPSNAISLFSDQESAHFEPLAQKPPPASPVPVASSQTCRAEVSGVEAGCSPAAGLDSTAELPSWWSRFSLRGVAKYVSFVLCFLSAWGKNGNRCLPAKLFSGLTKKLRLFTPKLTLKSAAAVGAPKCIVVPRLRQMFNSLAFKLTRLVAFVMSYLPTKLMSLVPAVLWHPTRLRLPAISSLTCPPIVSSFSSLSSLPLYLFPVPSRPSLSSLSRSDLTPSVHRYLLDPSPLFLPCLLVVFLLAVMLTASQSLVLALILATPLGLTLCYLENVVSSHRRAVSPTFTSKTPGAQSEDRSGSPLTPTHTPPRIRHHAHTGATWTQEMCDPAA
ncbi:uncharacterized protein LOC117727554 [Cyclopterus lumpus]|uniref:uncharacterized protein LOC117727554 n=1 Tax=Cyclopterus lumpus TaxID=8103 RepID=UPI001487118B|nr:uncharacterized protein LOC117727554 [Cyclopterus lumpus]